MCVLRAPAVLRSVEQYPVHLDFILSRIAGAKCSDTFLHYASARFTATTGRDTSGVVTKHAQTTSGS